MRWVEAKSILSNWSSGDGWFGANYNMNTYKGCCHGCIYCDSRSECYRVDSFDEVRGKKNALLLLEKDLSSKKRKGIIATGAMSDPYNPMEIEHSLTRGSLDLINRHGFGVTLLTKSALITRDIDLLCKIKEHSPVMVKLTITTYDDNLCKKIEPNVTITSERLKALKEISAAGIFTGIMMWPLLPFINDTEENILAIIRAAADNGAAFVSPCFGVTLRQNQRLYYYQQLDKLFPGVKEKYITTYGNSYACDSPNKQELYEVFKKECRGLGLLYKMSDIRVALKKQHECEQLSLFNQ